MQKGYLRIPRAWFSSDAWRKATHEQRSVLIDLCFRVAFREIDVEVNRMNVHIGVGQVAMSQKDMMKVWGMTRQKVRGVISSLEELGFLATNVATKGFKRCTILTVISLTKECNQGQTPISNQSLKEEGNKKKELPPKKYPPGGVFRTDDSEISFDENDSGDTHSETPASMQVDSKKEKLTLSKQIENARNEYAEKWRKYHEDELDASAKRLMFYLPHNAARICNDQKMMQYIHHSAKIPLVHDTSLGHLDEFFRFHLLDFVYKSGLRTKMHVDALLHLADTLHQRSCGLNVAQVTLFFYLLANTDHRIGKLEWNGWFESDKVTKAFGTYLVFIQNIP